MTIDIPDNIHISDIRYRMLSHVSISAARVYNTFKSAEQVQPIIAIRHTIVPGNRKKLFTKSRSREFSENFEV